MPEVLIWRALKQRPGNFKFRRQHPLDRFVLDFVCLEVRLAVEIDGEAHNRGDRPTRDAERDTIVAGYGFATLRIAARDVLADLNGMVEAIVAACRNRQPLHRPAAPAGPPPRSGEVLFKETP